MPEGLRFRASVPCDNGGVKKGGLNPNQPPNRPFNIYKAELSQKTGELYLAVEADGWKQDKTQVAVNSLKNKVQRVVKQPAK